MAQLRILIALAKDPGLVSGTHIGVNNQLKTSVSKNLTLHSGLCEHYIHVVHRFSGRQNSHRYKIKVNPSFINFQSTEGSHMNLQDQPVS